MVYILGITLLAGILFLLALIAAGVLSSSSAGSSGGSTSMNNQAGLVFEVYRYTVCFVMVLVFGIGAFLVVSGLLSQADSATLTSNGLLVLLSLALFAMHWRLKNPNAG